MLKTVLIGVGGIGRLHLGNLISLTRENGAIRLVAVCDINPDRFTDKSLDFNIKSENDGKVDFGELKTYTDAEEMLDRERPDLAVLALPTYLHCKYTRLCLERGINTFCEKPMALDVAQCREMLAAAAQSRGRLMIGQCLRFWGQYEYLKDCVVSGRFGAPVAGYFYRGGGLPKWSYNNWLQRRELGGGALHDQHVHDIDMVCWLYGMPEAVGTVGRIVVPGSGYDTISTNYIYSGLPAVNAQDDWVLNGARFEMLYRANFERGSVFFNRDGFFAAEAGGEKFTPDYHTESAYIREMRYFADCIISDSPNTVNPPEDSLRTVAVAVAEARSADNGGRYTAPEL